MNDNSNKIIHYQKKKSVSNLKYFVSCTLNHAYPVNYWTISAGKASKPYRINPTGWWGAMAYFLTYARQKLMV